MNRPVITHNNMEKIVLDIFNKCILDDSMQNSRHVLVQGLEHTFCLKQDVLEGSRETIQEMLRQLPDFFRSEKGWSFNCLGNIKTGPWAGKHKHFEMLMVLAMGLGMMEYVSERSIWHTLPSGKPYIRITA